MTVHNLVCLVLAFISTVHGLYNGRMLCSHCHGHTHKQQCHNFQLCEPGELCFTTTYTINGQPLLYSGCMPNTDCSTLGSQQIDQSADLPPGSVVIEQRCCGTDGCNGLQGLNNRTACMSCSEYDKYPTQCQHAILCNPLQECLFYQFLDTNTYQKRIHLSCANHEVCDILRSQSPPIFGKRDELAMKKHCCKTDYCNLFWDQTSSSFVTNAHTTSTAAAVTTTPTTTSKPTTSTKPTTAATTTAPSTTQKTATTGIHFIPITNPKTTQKPIPSKTFVTLTNPPTTFMPRTTQVPQITTDFTDKTISTLNHAGNTSPVPVSTQHIPTAITTQPTTATTTSTTTTTTTLPTTSTEPPANKCYSSSKDSNIQTVIGCPDEAPYCLNNLTNYVSGNVDVSKGCATAAQCYWIPRDVSSVYCDIYSSSHAYFAEFMCSYCCTGELCNQDTVASPNTPFNPTVIPPNPITHSPQKSTDCYTCADCHDPGTLTTCSGNTPYCLNRYSSTQWGVTHISKRCGSKQECHSQYYEATRYNLLCSVFDENMHDNMRLECVFCCTTPNCNEHARPPQSTLYKE